jgi:hypothetical protein
MEAVGRLELTDVSRGQQSTRLPVQVAGYSRNRVGGWRCSLDPDPKTRFPSDILEPPFFRPCVDGNLVSPPHCS